MVDVRTRASPRKRADAVRNEATLLNAAAAMFVESGVQTPVREIAARAGVGVGTIYRHFPTRADLVVGVYRHQVDTLAAAAPALLASDQRPYEALSEWVDMFVDFLVTKRGLAKALQSDDEGFQVLHTYFLDRLLPACEALIDAVSPAGEARVIGAYELLRGVGNLCIGGEDSRYDARRLVRILVRGLWSQDADRGP